MMFDINKLKHLGKGASIGEFVKIVNPENVEVGDFSRIDDFSLLVATKDIKIGNFVHIASFVGVTGGGEFRMDDFSGLAIGVKILTGSDDFLGGGMMGPCIPKKYLNPISGKVMIEKHAVIGANSVVLPNVTVGEGAVVGANCLVLKNLSPWGVYVGSPVKRIKNRRKDIICESEKKILKECLSVK